MQQTAIDRASKRQHVTRYGEQMGRRCRPQRYSGVHFSGNVSYGRACAVLQSVKLTRGQESQLCRIQSVPYWHQNLATA